VRAVILDADAMSDIDYTGLQALRGLAAELAGQKVTFAIARASHLVHHDLKHGAFLEKLGADRLFNSVEEAVGALQRHP
jgi:MFS superfamily sulfate permease-like transporter